MPLYKLATTPLIASLFGAAFLCSAPAVAGPANVPFKAAVTITETLTATAPEDVGATCTTPIQGMTTGMGNASHLGRVAVVATDCVGVAGTTLYFGNGRMTITAANGDLLYGRYYGAFNSTGAVSAAGLPTYQMYGAGYSIEGGTGRYANARGQGTMKGTEDLSKDPFNPATPSRGAFQLDGTISY
jgi:hypothetical protein